MYVFICGGHHCSDRIAVLVMVSKADSIVLYLSSSISCSIMYTCQDFLPSLRVLHPGYAQTKYIKENCIVHADSTNKNSGGFAN